MAKLGYSQESIQLLLPKVYTNGKEEIQSGWLVSSPSWIHWCNNDLHYQELELETIPLLSHTAQAQAELVQNIMEEWGLQTLFRYLTSDSAANMTSMDQFLQVDAEMKKCLNHILI